MEVVTALDVTAALAAFTGVITDNIAPILIFGASIGAFSIVMAMLDIRRENNYLDDRAKFWRKAARNYKR